MKSSDTIWWWEIFIVYGNAKKNKFKFGIKRSNEKNILNSVLYMILFYKIIIKFIIIIDQIVWKFRVLFVGTIYLFAFGFIG